jgi:hemolysin III
VLADGRPLLRGRIHAAALVAAVPAGLALVAAARSGSARMSALVYAASLIALFGASSAYHRLARGERSSRWLRRLDHSTIYVLIAGSYTPLCVVVLQGWWGWSLLAVVWVAAVAGIVLKLVRFDASRRIGAVLYIAMGWAVAAASPVLVGAVPTSTLVLLVAGGLIYTVGAVVLLTKVPNPFPRVFGYHEVWHTMVVVAGVLHYLAIRQIVA